MPRKKKKKNETKEMKDVAVQTVDKTEIVEEIKPIVKAPEKRNEVEIKPKSFKCSCNPCSFRIKSKKHTKTSETKANGEILTEEEEKTYNVAFNSLITPETATPNTKSTMARGTS